MLIGKLIAPIVALVGVGALGGALLVTVQHNLKAKVESSPGLVSVTSMKDLWKLDELVPMICQPVSKAGEVPDPVNAPIKRKK